MDGLTEGRIVHYVMPDGDHRPAIVVRVWDRPGNGNGYVNLQVFTDGNNDLPPFPEDKKKWSDYGLKEQQCETGIMWRTSIMYSETPISNSWHWIEKA